MRFHFKYTYEEFFFTTAWITGAFETEAFEAVIGSVPVTPFGADTLKVVVPADLPVTGRVDTSVTECIPHRIPDVRLFRIRLFTKRIIQQLSVNTDIYFRPR